MSASRQSSRRKSVKNYCEEELVAGFTCSISNCGLSFQGQESLEAHLKEHLQREMCKLEKLPLKRPNSGGGHKQEVTKDLADLRVQTYARLRERRERRRLQAASSYSGDSDGTITVCQVCLQDVHGSLDDHRDHVKACIRVTRSNHEETSGGFTDDYSEEMEDFEEYEWSGQTRIRASSLVALGATGGDFTKIQKTDESDDLDITGDTENFGPNQYSEENLVQINSDLYHENKDDSSQPGSSNIELIKENSENDKNINKDYKENELQEKIKALEDNLCTLTNEHACRVCLDTISRHVVSTVCWHVHCETCWIKVLATKKICPQCKAIVTPGDLRRVYL